MEPDRIVIGASDDADGQAVADLYADLEAPVIRTDVATAEMIKYASNAFLATKISFINEIANVCEEVGADVVGGGQGMGLDARIGAHFLRPGIGFGGSCFPKDVNALKQLAGNSGYHFQLLTAVIEVNELQKRRVVGKLSGTWERCGAAGSRCSASPSRPTPTTCARRRAWFSPRASGPRARTWSATTRSRWGTRAPRSATGSSSPAPSSRP